MALGSNHNTITTGANFIPELWSNEVIAAYKTNAVLRNLVTLMSHTGKKGDTIHVPNFTRGSANDKAASTQVTLNQATHGVTNLTIATHKEYSYLIEDILDVQALTSLRAQYTDDAGYQLAKEIDEDLHLLGATLQGGSIAGATNLYEAGVIGSDGSTTFSGSANTNTGNGATLTDAGIRRMIQTLDDQDVPMEGRSIILPPVERKNILGISRFTEQAFVGDGSAIKNGMIAKLYGIPIYVSTNCPWIHVNSVTGTQSVTFSSTAPTGAAYSDEFSKTVDWSTSTPSDTKYRVGMMLHKGAMALVEQLKVRSQIQYKQEYLATLFTADTIYGVGELRDTSGVAFVVPA